MVVGSASRARAAQASVRKAPATRQNGRSAARLPSTVSVTPAAAPRIKTTSRNTRMATTCMSGSTARQIRPTTRRLTGPATFPSPSRDNGATFPAAAFVLESASPRRSFGASQRPSQAPAAVSSSQLPRLMPNTSSLPENAPRSSRISASCVMTADTPSVPTASNRSRRVRSGRGRDWSVTVVFCGETTDAHR